MRQGKPARLLRRGFTLIELLIVVVIIGVLAAIAIPKFQNTKGKANLAYLKSDLRNLATAEEAFYVRDGQWRRMGREGYPPAGISHRVRPVHGGRSCFVSGDRGGGNQLPVSVGP